MKAKTGIAVQRVDFSDPQGGKGSCDRKAATVKAHVRRYINEGHDVSSCMGLFRPKNLDPKCIYYNHENNGAGPA